MDRFARGASQQAVIFRNDLLTYGDLVERVARWRDKLVKDGIRAGDAVSIIGDFSPNTIALFLALTSHKCMLVPLSRELDSARQNNFLGIAQVAHIYCFDANDTLVLDRKTDSETCHPLFQRLRSADRAGLVLFSSGSTGQSKAALLDLFEILKKFEIEKRVFRTAGFLLFDHIGGINTLLYVLSNLGTFVTMPDRSPSSVLSHIEKHRIELLPTSPTFIKLILLSEAYLDFDLSSLRLVTYGTEPMAQQILNRFINVLPHARLQQTYGLTEVGILRSQSKENDSLWMRIGGEGYQWRVVDGILQIRSNATMLGYLNADAPITSDGWFITGDEVEVDGDYVRILGRRSELINVGGLKVYPAEVEGVIEMLGFVESATVRGEKNALVGNIVRARVKLCNGIQMTDAEAITKIKSWCAERLDRLKVPARIEITEESQHNIRFKKMRNETPS
jgi:long-chain acyl-CoA synthetase